MKGICDGGDDEEQGLPTLLKRKKRGMLSRGNTWCCRGNTWCCCVVVALNSYYRE